MTLNVYFSLTEEFNAEGQVAILASGQAVVFYRLAIMSKDGDWIISETEAACRRVLEVLGTHVARQRPSAPLDPRWLAGGWSSHFEFRDERKRRVRCDFFSRPPRVPEELRQHCVTRPARPRLVVVSLRALLLMKQTQRAKDYAVIGELARLLPPEQELEFTTDADAILRLAGAHGGGSQRPAVREAVESGERARVVAALAHEIDALQVEDRVRLGSYQQAAQRYLAAFRERGLDAVPADEAHPRAVELAVDLLPKDPLRDSG